ncbi:MAG: hypothetical protein KJ879_02740, partial [Nanoarchaeota archaeon]|nr:hypothetical protein [Nanoarchaeota archaeon]
MVAWLSTGLFLVAGFFISAFFLKLSSKLYKTENTGYGLAMKVLWIPFIIGAVLALVQPSLASSVGQVIYYVLLIVNLVLSIWIAKTNYHVKGWRAFEILFIGGLFSVIFYAV